MKDLTIFENSNFGKITIIEKDGEPWFVAKEVCGILTVGNVTNALIEIDNDDKSDISLTKDGNNISKLRIINESGFYHLILKSRKPNAKQFKRWVTHEVLPSIRKTGSYSCTPQTYAGEYSSDILLRLKHVGFLAEGLADSKPFVNKC